MSLRLGEKRQHSRKDQSGYEKNTNARSVGGAAGRDVGHMVKGIRRDDE